MRADDSSGLLVLFSYPLSGPRSGLDLADGLMILLVIEHFLIICTSLIFELQHIREATAYSITNPHVSENQTAMNTHDTYNASQSSHKIEGETRRGRQIDRDSTTLFRSFMLSDESTSVLTVSV